MSKIEFPRNIFILKDKVLLNEKYRPKGFDNGDRAGDHKSIYSNRWYTMRLEQSNAVGHIHNDISTGRRNQIQGRKRLSSR